MIIFAQLLSLNQEIGFKEQDALYFLGHLQNNKIIRK
jgi:hypothetical protein